MEKPRGQESYFSGGGSIRFSEDMHLSPDLKEAMASSKNQRRKRIPSRGTIQAKARSQNRAFLFLVQVGGRSKLARGAKGRVVSYVTAGWAESAVKCIQGLSGCSGQNKLGWDKPRSRETSQGASQRDRREVEWTQDWLRDVGLHRVKRLFSITVNTADIHSSYTGYTGSQICIPICLNVDN